MTINDWEKTYGARRRAIDKKLLAEAERQIDQEERAALILNAVNPLPPVDRDEARKRIALAFGRTLI
jgi:hypothetical protein